MSDDDASQVWQLVFTDEAAKQFAKLDKPVRRRIDGALAGLASDPRPVGAIKLKGSSGAMRYRVGDWRIIYQIRDGELVIVVIEIGHRSHVYRNF